MKKKTQEEEKVILENFADVNERSFNIDDYEKRLETFKSFIKTYNVSVKRPEQKTGLTDSASVEHRSGPPTNAASSSRKASTEGELLSNDPMQDLTEATKNHAEKFRLLETRSRHHLRAVKGIMNRMLQPLYPGEVGTDAEGGIDT